MSKFKTAKAAVIIMVLSLASKLLGFLRETFIADRFGASVETDAYLVAITIPTVLFASVAASLGTSFIPVFTEWLEKKDRDEAFNFVNNLVNLLIVFCLLFSLFGMALSPLLVKFLAPGFKDYAYYLTATLIRMSFPIVFFIALTYIASSILQVFGNFTIPALIGIPYNFIIITFLVFLSGIFGIKGLTIATLIASASQLIIHLPYLKKMGYSYSFTLDINHPAIRRIFILILPVIMGSAAYQINTIVDRILASTLEEGSISALNFANRLNGLTIGIFTAAISTVMYPRLSKYAVERDWANFKDSLVKAINYMLTILIPSATGLIILRVPIIKFLFERGAFDSRDTMMTAYALMFFSIGLVAVGINDVLNKAFFSLQDTRTPMIGGMIAVLINISANLILIRYLKLGGLALGTSTASITLFAILLLKIDKKLDGINKGKIMVCFLKVLVSSLIMGAVCYSAYNLLDLSLSVKTVFVIFLGGISYIISVIMLKLEEAEYVLRVFKSRLEIVLNKF